eukprot:Mycagemm_TRINITY_DN10266_c0_g1::TRINITY_DN10266_c0_g1_i2::g.3826::m.3826 type:complete len:122 gc:universal TRINITY_DN10266_c0_g1_i2:847-1212(+)
MLQRLPSFLQELLDLATALDALAQDPHAWACYSPRCWASSIIGRQRPARNRIKISLTSGSTSGLVSTFFAPTPVCCKEIQQHLHLASPPQDLLPVHRIPRFHSLTRLHPRSFRTANLHLTR